MENQTRPTRKMIKISEIKRLLSEGYTRYEKQNLVEDGFGYGSIEKYFDLSVGEVKEIFQHHKLKGIKVKPPTYILIDDEEIEEDDDFIEERQGTPTPLRNKVTMDDIEEPVEEKKADTDNIMYFL